MTAPIIPVATVSNVITIQPVATTVANREQGGGANPLSALPQGTTVEGFVVNRDAQSNPILRTPLGDLRITSDVFLKTGSEVIFRVDSSQSSLARIVTVDGLSPQDYSTSSARGLARDTISPSSLQPAPTTTLATAVANANPGGANAAPVLQAIVLQAASALPVQSPVAAALAAAQGVPLPIITQLSQLRAGTPLKLTLLDLKIPPMAISMASLPPSSNLSALLSSPPPAATLPGNTSAGSAQPAPAPLTNPVGTSTPQAAEEAAAPTAPAPSTPAPASAPANSSAAGTVAPTPTNISPNFQTAAPAANAAIAEPPAQKSAQAYANKLAQPAQNTLAPGNSANQLVATVIGHDADGANILQTPFASLKVYTAQPLPTGTTLLVRPELSSNTEAEPPALPGLSAAAAPTALQRLSSLGEVIRWLNTNQPDVAQDAMQRVPNVSHQLMNGLLNYINGMRAGDIGDIIGKRALRLLEISNPDLLSRLRQQVEQVQANAVDSPIAQWNAMPVPLFFGGELHAAQLFIHKEPTDEAKTAGKHGHGQRFILEVEMSQLGPLQFDGFVRSQERGKSFDLMVRSNEPFPNAISSGIRDIFTNSIEATRMHGQVIFQPGQQHFVKPDAPASPFLGTGVNTILA